MKELNMGIKILLGILGVILLINLVIFGVKIGAVALLIYLVYKFSKKLIMKIKDRFTVNKVEQVEIVKDVFEKEKVVIDVDYRSA